MSDTTIPVIDLAPALQGNHAERLRVAREIEAACTDIGFFTITGHGVPLALIDTLRGHDVEGTAREYEDPPLRRLER